MKFKVIEIGAPGFVKQIDELKEGEVYITMYPPREGQKSPEYDVQVAMQGSCCSCWSPLIAQVIAELVEANKERCIAILKHELAPKKDSQG